MSERRVLAVCRPGHAGDGTRSVAAAVAGLVGAGFRVHALAAPLLAEDSERERRDLLRLVAAGDVAAIVIEGGSADAEQAMRLAASIDLPVVFAPPATRTPFELRRVLLPLDGSREATEAVSEAARMVRAAGLELIVLHCVHERSVPRFEDHPHYDPLDWAREFTARYLAAFGQARLEVRAGIPGEQAIDVAAAAGADLIVLGWSRKTAKRRAATVRSILERSAVPVMLLPVHQPDSVP